MSQPAVKWSKVERYFLRRGYVIKSQGGDKIIQAPKDGDAGRSRQQIRIGHTSCSKSGSQVLPCYLAKFKNVFNVKIEDILND
jgi:hypothetical protein